LDRRLGGVWLRHHLLVAALYLLPKRRRRRPLEGLPDRSRSRGLLRGSGISAIRLLYLLPRCLLRWRRCRRRRRRRRRQETVTCPPPPPPPLVDEELQATSPFGHLLRDISLVRGAQARDFKSG